VLYMDCMLRGGSSLHDFQILIKLQEMERLHCACVLDYKTGNTLKSEVTFLRYTSDALLE
jgi:hypothetical protein